MEVTSKYMVSVTIVKGLSHQTTVSELFNFKFENCNTDSFLIVLNKYGNK